MPFTFSHPAIVLPLTRYSGRYISLTGLVIGSLTPDFEYFIRMKVQSDFSHTIGGLFYFDLPVGLLLTFLFHDIIRNPLYDNLPSIFRDRLDVFKTFSWNAYFKHRFFGVIVSVLIGAVTHLFWDSFTHVHGYSVQSFPVLRKTFQIAGHDIPFYKLLQHFSTLIGGLIIVLAFFRIPSKAVPTRKISLTYWLTFLTIAGLIVTIRIAAAADNDIGLLTVTTISAGLIALIIAPILTRK